MTVIGVRQVVESDRRDLWLWRNDAASVEASLSATTVSWSDHVDWFQRSLEDARRVIYVGELEADKPIKVGMCRFDFEQDGRSAEVSINLNPALRGKRLSSSLLAGTLALFHNEFPQVTRITAVVRESNAPSNRLFLASGFTMSANNSDTKEYELLLGE